MQEPIALAACPSTLTITNTIPCPTGRDCSTSWSTKQITPTGCLGDLGSPTASPSPRVPEGSCLPLPVSDNIYGIPVSDLSAFTNSSNAATIASGAVTPIPYKQVFRNRLASVSGGGYLGFKVIPYYDPFLCASICDDMKGCLGFNIFFERDPTLEPSEYCPNPPAGINVKCSFWRKQINANGDMNPGEQRYATTIPVLSNRLAANSSCN